MKLRMGYRLVVAMLATLAGSHTAGACALWSAAGVYEIRQSNGFRVSLTLRQSPTSSPYEQGRFAVSGQASYPGVAGSVEGHVKGPEFYFVVYWHSGTGARGIYQGRISNGGQIVGGTTYDANNRSSNATWNTTKILECIVK